MAEEQHNIEEITFFGRQDSDTDLDFMQKGNFLYALNIVNNSSGVGNKGIVKNLKGNKEIAFGLPEIGSNKCIGTAEDNENNRFIFFLYNDQALHGIYQYDGLSKKVTRLILNLEDTGNVDILKFNKDFLILHADVVRGILLYWVDALNNARKTNISKLLDKSATGYGDVIMQNFIDAYKQTAAFPPKAVYFSDTTKQFNRLYGALRKFAIRFLYDDGEKSNWSDFSAVALPPYEPSNGINKIPSDNNTIQITFETGDRTVIAIEIGMQSTSSELNNLSILDWVSIATLYKKKLTVTDNSFFTYNFYNDTNYNSVDQAKIIRPYSFLPKQPTCQSFVKNSLVYFGGKEGSPVVDINVTSSVRYEDLFIDPGTENEFNKPYFNFSNTGSDYVRGGNYITYFDGTVRFLRPSGAPCRFSRQTVTIGNDVKEGNNFSWRLTNGDKSYEGNVVATLTDSALSVANKVKQQLISTDRIYRKTPDLADTNIYDNSIAGGNVSFSFIIGSDKNDNYFTHFFSVNPVSFDKLKDTGQSVKNIKLGSTTKYGFQYEDFDGRKALVYTNDSLIISNKTINELGGYKATIITILINHKAPIWAKYYQIVRSNDLTYGSYIQMLVQQVVDINDDDAQDYQDLVVGSLFTYQKIHPNTPLTYEFQKGDRLRVTKNTQSDSYYPFFETEIIAYNPSVTQNIQSNIVTNGTANVVVAETNPDNIGKIISVGGYEREIVSVPSGTTYQLNNVIGGNDPQTYLAYDLIDRRGTIRIRKPGPDLVTIVDNSVVEVYKPANLVNAFGSKQFNEFQKKYVIINAGTDNAYHTGSLQDQTDVLPAIVEISEGTAYVRNREMPINNFFPGTQLIIETIEDQSFSDFYPSLMNDNGRVNAEDTGDGEIEYGSRARFSNNFIEDIRINGLNDFDNLDREDYNDQYGDFKRTVFDKNNIYCFKSLRSAYIPVDSKITIDDGGTSLRLGSAKLLNPIQYFAYEGGIGNNPEAYCSNGTHKYTLYAAAGVIIRIGGNGEEPISKTFFLDKNIRELLAEATKNKAKIFLGFNRKLSLLVITIEGYNKYIYYDGFEGWILQDDIVPDTTVFEILTPPSNGTLTPNGIEPIYQGNLDYIGPDSFTYRAFIDGAWSNPEKVCINVVDIPVSLAWRQKEGSFFCVRDQYGLRTGYKGWDLLEQYNIFDGTTTGLEKPNVDTDPDYVLPISDTEACVPEPVDDTPNVYAFTPIINAELDTLYGSDAPTITGINVPVLVVSLGGFEFRINGGVWSTVPLLLVNNDTVEIRRNSSVDYSTTATATLVVGGVSADFNITTKPNLTPDPYAFDPVINATPLTLYTSNSQLITGITGAAPVIMSVGGEYEIDLSGIWTSDDGTINNGQSIRVRQTSDPAYEVTTVVTLDIGGVTAPFSVTNMEPPEFGNEFRSAEYRRNNCNPATETGTVVPTSVEADTYFAATLTEANAQADAYIASVGQDNANAQGYCLLNNTNSIALLDMYHDDGLDVGVYIDTPGVTESLNMAYTGNNFYLPTDPAATAFLLASDPIEDFTNKRRFAINIGKLIGMYPDDVAIPEFIFKVRGRSTVAGTKTGAYSLKDPDMTLIMTGSPGTYMCGAVPAGGPSPTSWSAFCPGGGDGSIGIGIGEVILTLTYNRAANTFIAT